MLHSLRSLLCASLKAAADDQDLADSNNNGVVSFAELVAVFEIESLRSPALRRWVEAQTAVADAVAEAADASGEMTGAATKIQAVQRGKAARKEREDNQLRVEEAHTKYDEWRASSPDGAGEG